MTLIDLIDDLEKELNDLFENSKFETEAKMEIKTPKITTGWHIPKTTRRSKGDIEKSKEDFPSILITPIIENETLDESKAEILLVFGGYSEERNGWKDVFSMAEKVRQHLKTSYSIGQRFPIDSNFRITFPDEQPYPTWFCWMNISCNIYNPTIGPLDADIF